MKLDLITNKKEILGLELNPNDEFYTPIYAIEPLLEYIKPNSKIWCPFDTELSNFKKIFETKGHTVICSHIWEGDDFFSMTVPNCDYIISNPPYSLKFEVFEKLFDIGKPFAMLVGVVGIFESQKRFNLFRENTFEILYFNKRISYFQDYNNQKPNLNPPFSSVYITKDMLPSKIEFKCIKKV
jgi:hypothetical protein